VEDVTDLDRLLVVGDHVAHNQTSALLCASVPAGGIVVEAVAVADVVCPAGSSRPVSALTQAAETTNIATAPAPSTHYVSTVLPDGRPVAGNGAA